jgi:hypothetical protein
MRKQNFALEWGADPEAMFMVDFKYFVLKIMS